MLPILLTFAYLIGSISTAIVICKILNLPDPRTQGSNNPGATNVLRIAGKKAAIITLLSDALKGGVAVIVARYFGLDLLATSLIALAVFLGHLYPIFFGFKGGKGVATFVGALFALNIWAGLGFALTWLFVAKVLKMSSPSALIATLFTPIYFYYATHNPQASFVIVLICVWIFYTHKSNIKRIISGAEKPL